MSKSSVTHIDNIGLLVHNSKLYRDNFYDFSSIFFLTRVNTIKFGLSIKMSAVFLFKTLVINAL